MSIASLFSFGFVPYFAVFVRVKQIVVKVDLKNTAVNSV